MSILRSTYYEYHPDRDRWGSIPENDDQPMSLHIAATGWDHIHLAIERNDDGDEINITIDEAFSVIIALFEAIQDASRGIKKEPTE
jgi:hypothetical protein